MVTTLKSDIDIQQDVLEELRFDPEVNPADVGVEVHDGVVTLTGAVSSYAEKWSAERAAFRVAGVHAVANDLTVKLPGTGTADDTEIAKNIADAFAHNILIPKTVKVRVSQGDVTLEGKVQWQYQRNVAERIARSTRGVKWVANLIEVEQPSVKPDEVEEEVRRALIRSATVDADRVHIAVSGSHVTLTGTVRSWAEREEAERAAWRTKGVVSVTNDIIVKS